MNTPKIFSMWEPEGKRMGWEASTSNGAKDIGQGKFLTTFITPRIYETVKGEIIEVGADGRGSTIYAKWPDKQSAFFYKPTFPKHVQNEQW